MYMKATICVLLDIALVSGGETGEGWEGGGGGGCENMRSKEILLPLLCAQTYIYAHKRISMRTNVLITHMSSISRVSGSCMCMCAMTHLYVGHDSFMRTHVVCLMCIWFVYLCVGVMTHSYVFHDSFTRGTWLIHTNTCSSFDVCRDLIPVFVFWYTNVRAMTHSQVGHDSLPSGTWLIYAHFHGTH